MPVQAVHEFFPPLSRAQLLLLVSRCLPRAAKEITQHALQQNALQQQGQLVVRAFSGSVSALDSSLRGKTTTMHSVKLNAIWAQTRS